MFLVEKVPREVGRVGVFETAEEDRASVVETKLSKDSKAALIDVSREISEAEESG
jgi:hypothetical protein